MAAKDHVALALAYQAAVLNGTVPACKWVKLACARNERDLGRQGTPDFPYRFDAETGARICQFAELLPHIKGAAYAFVIGQDEDGRSLWNTIVLEPWQCWILSTLFGWKRADGTRRFRVALVLVPRKNAKSSMGAIIALYMFAVEGGSGAECYSAATTRDQAKIVAEIAWEMAARSPQFREQFGIKLGSRTTRSLSIPATAAKFGPLSADAQSLDGLNVLLAVIDELHAHKTRAVWDVLDTATGAQREPLLVALTTAGVEIGGICHEKLSYLERVLDGAAVDETLFGINYTIDSSPHDDILEPKIALGELETLCSCDRHAFINTERFIREAFVEAATTVGIAAKVRHAALTIQTEAPRREISATPVISDGASRSTPNSRNTTNDRTQRAVENGRDGTAISAKRPARDTGQVQTCDGSSKSAGAATHTESHQSNTIACGEPKNTDALYAKGSLKSYTWITAIAREIFGDSSASDATARSVFSATLKKVYNAHSHTCSVRSKSRLLDNGSLSISRPGDDIRDVIVQRKANPNYGVSVQPDDLARKVAEAEQVQSAKNNVLTKHFNVWIRSESTWMGHDAWQRVSKTPLTWEMLKAFPCWIGVDLGEVRDFSAVVLVFKTDVDHYAVIPYIYVPEAAIAQSPVAQLSGWVRDGHVIQTIGSEADYQRIEDDLVRWFERVNVQEIDFDRRSARLMIQKVRQRLEPRLGRDAVDLKVVDVPQSVETFDPAMKTTERTVAGVRLEHDGNPCQAWMIANVVIERNYRDEIYPRKAGGKDSPNKIDGPVAMWTALSRAMQAKPAEAKFQMFFAGKGTR